MNNNSYAYMPAYKLVALISESCPPIPYNKENGCYGSGEDCVNCWYDWLKDGE